MEQAQTIQLSDLRRLAESGAAELAEAVLSFLRQGDPRPEGPRSEGAIDPDRLQALLQRAYAIRKDDERRLAIAAIWQQFLAQTNPPPPPRFFLPELLVDLYEHGSEPGRAALVEIAKRAPLSYGLWAGLKRIYKLAEARHDAELFGALAARFDLKVALEGHQEVSSRTLFYLRTRAWRFLRQLGTAVPALYPQFAVQMLIHYPSPTPFDDTWVANHVFRHKSRQYERQRFHGRLPEDLVKHRAFDDAWKRSPDPLMVLLEQCQADPPARFAIQSLRKDFPQVLRNVTPAWLERVARRPLASIHDFVVETLQASPDFHAGKLRGLGLHEMVLGLLLSPSARARTYAIEYARAQAQDLAATRLAELVEGPYDDTRQFAAAMFRARPARELGYPLLGRLLASSISEWAAAVLDQGFDRSDLPRRFLIDMLYGHANQRKWASGYLEKRFQPGELDAGFWREVLDDERAQQPANNAVVRLVLNALAKFPPSAIGASWLLDAALRPGFGVIWSWLKKADALPGLDLEKVKGLVFDTTWRQHALELLGNPKLARLKDLGLPWLLALARRADPTLNQFASRYLLQHVKPDDFSEGGDKKAGIDRLFQLALGDKEPEAVRAFAQTYLRVHHPKLGPEQPESSAYQLKPQLPASAYTPERIWPRLRDPRADVRRFAVAITRADLRRWGWQGRVYELGESDAKEVRNIAYDALRGAGEPGADAALALTLEELDPARVFAMTESRIRSTREVAMELISKHYARLGGAERLGWLMASADRTVRLMAVRLLWEKHRPRHLPEGWKPHGSAAVPVEDAGRFKDVEALREFLRTVLFGLPPGRSMEGRDPSGPQRHVPASVAKQHAVEVAVEMGVEDEAFAKLIAPVLLEFTGSLAKGEWQACLSALVRLQRAHPDLDLGLKRGS